jgi:hypothetical protein
MARGARVGHFLVSTPAGEIRLIGDQTWGGSIPGTPTALPPV